jgi:hypothetical protein
MALVGWPIIVTSPRPSAGDVMRRKRWKSMSVDELWTIHEEITAILSDKIAAEKVALRERLRKAELQPGFGKKLNQLTDRLPKRTTKTK